MDGQDYPQRCEYGLIRGQIGRLLQKYDNGSLTASTAYAEAGRLLDYDPLCAEGMFLRFYGLKILLPPEKNEEFFSHTGRPEVRLLRQIVADGVEDDDEYSEVRGQKLHYYLRQRQEILSGLSREFYDYLQSFYHWGKAAGRGDIYEAAARKILLFETIYTGGGDTLLMPLALQSVQPYLQYLLEIEGGLADIPRLHEVFALIKAVMDRKLRENSLREADLRRIAFAVLEGELGSRLKDIDSPKRIDS